MPSVGTISFSEGEEFDGKGRHDTLRRSARHWGCGKGVGTVGGILPQFPSSVSIAHEAGITAENVDEKILMEIHLLFSRMCFI